MGSPKSPPPPPPVPLPPPLAPQLANNDVAKAGQSYMQSQQTARGLAGTILTSGQGTGSGTSYSGKQLTGQ